MTSLRTRLGRELVVGVEIASGSPSAVELAGGLGFDLAVLDARHAAVSVYGLEHERLVRAADAAGLTVITRVVENTPGTINRALNDGSSGVLVACDTADEGRRAAHSMRYPPHGFRGAAPVVRAARLGLTPWDEYWRRTNSDKPLLVSIESDVGLSAVGDIAATEGVDAVVLDLGPLTRALRVDGDSSSFADQVVASIQRVVAAGCCAGVVVSDGADAPLWCRHGARFVLLGTDLDVYANTTRALRSTLDAVPTRLRSGS